MYYGAGSVRESVFIALMPYIEQGAMYSGYISRIQELAQLTPRPAHTVYGGYVNDFANMRVDAFLCPSDEGQTAALSGQSRPTNYHVSLGDWPTYSASGNGNGKTDNPRGAFSLRHDQSRTIGAFKDGTSNTVVFSECLIGLNADANNMEVPGNFAQSLGATFGQPSGDPGTAAVVSPATTSNLSVCWATMSDKRFYKAGTNLWRGNLGRRWGDSAPVYTAFMTIFPPNSGPNCLAGGELSMAVVTASSSHTGGVNCGLGDGSVRLVSSTVNGLSTGIPADYSNPSGKTSIIASTGPSAFGAWGALGSINGGESTDIP